MRPIENEKQLHDYVDAILFGYDHNDYAYNDREDFIKNMAYLYLEFANHRGFYFGREPVRMSCDDLEEMLEWCKRNHT